MLQAQSLMADREERVKNVIDQLKGLTIRESKTVLFEVKKRISEETKV